MKQETGIKKVLEELLLLCDEYSNAAIVLMDSVDNNFGYYSLGFHNIKDWVMFDLLNVARLLLTYDYTPNIIAQKNSDMYRRWVEHGKERCFSNNLFEVNDSEINFLCDYNDYILDNENWLFPPHFSNAMDEYISNPESFTMPSILVLASLDAMNKKRIAGEPLFWELYFDSIKSFGNLALSSARNDSNTYLCDDLWLSKLISVKKALWFEIAKNIDPEFSIENNQRVGVLASEQKDDLSNLIEELNSLIGLENIKNDVVSLINLLKIRKMRKERGMPQQPMSLHMVFMGNPGTGKTIVARLLAKIYKSLNVISNGQFVEVDRAGLVGGYVGQTALKASEVINSAKGGILFIDEAYSLFSNNDSDYGKEAINILLKAMEDNRDDLIVIVAGYPELMEKFLSSNPGLHSRFNKYLHFKDYTPDELLEILMQFARQEGMSLSAESQWKARSYFTYLSLKREENFANAREARNYFEKAIIKQANRLAQFDYVNQIDLSLILPQDLED